VSELDGQGELELELEAAMPVTLEQMTPWPFGEGPLEWRFTVEWRPATDTDSQPSGLHLLCGECGQSMTRLGAWAHTLASLKPQISLHVMQVHREQVMR
jgi:hypothetical protein